MGSLEQPLGHKLKAQAAILLICHLHVLYPAPLAEDQTICGVSYLDGADPELIVRRCQVIVPVRGTVTSQSRVAVMPAWGHATANPPCTSATAAAAPL